jgi:serine/threonine protein kinase/Tol biopolymer transport system component
MGQQEERSLTGQTLAHYRITAALGSGGMGEVYRATDTKLGREVALKVLPPEVARDTERLGRFEREARLLGSLNHPNVAAIHGLEEVGSTRFLVLELVDGEDLSERLKRGPIAVEEAREIAIQIAQALEGAHEKGIVHRDLKPANVKLTPDGQVKVLDFGLAKAWTGEGAASGSSSSADLSQSPTLVHSGTQAGVILGTAAYMSPEQARGKAVDKRADIWAFGVVLFEMLTGRRLFAGETVSDILAAVLKEEPPWGALPSGLPLTLRRVLRRCLQKQPRDRFHDIADVRLELGEAPETEASTSEMAPRSPWPRRALPWTLALAAAGVAAWLGLRSSDERSLPRTVVASILPPPGAEFIVERGLALSPDGGRLVFAARDDQGASALWLRSLDNSAARKLAGTEEGQAPFWSPDGRHLGFFVAGKLKRMELETGLVENLADDAGEAPSAAWSPRGEIAFSGWTKALKRVAATGGVPEELFPARVSLERAWPTFLPDGTHFLFLARDYADTLPQRQLRVASLDGGVDREIRPLNSNALYAPSGHLVWWQDGNLRAQRFDAERLATVGEPRVIAAGVQFDPSQGLGAFSLSGTTLVYREGAALLGDELVRLSRTGEELGPVGPPGNYYHPRLSPDGSRVAVDRSDETNRGDIWVYEIDRGTGTRLSTATEDESYPQWSPDGRRIVYWAAVGEGNVVRVQASGGGGPEEELPIDRATLPHHVGGHVEGLRPRPSGWSSRGVIFLDRGGDIWVWALDDRSLSPFLETPFTEQGATPSADGRFVAYDSDETGRPEVYVRTFPDSGRRWRVSTDGGRAPAWRRDGGEIYYTSADGKLTAVTVGPSTGGGGEEDLRFGSPHALFPVEEKPVTQRQFDTLDGETFVVNRPRRTGSRSPLTLVLNVDLEAHDSRQR